MNNIDQVIALEITNQIQQVLLLVTMLNVTVDENNVDFLSCQLQECSSTEPRSNSPLPQYFYPLHYPHNC